MQRKSIVTEDQKGTTRFFYILKLVREVWRICKIEGMVSVVEYVDDVRLSLLSISR